MNLFKNKLKYKTKDNVFIIKFLMCFTFLSLFLSACQSQNNNSYVLLHAPDWFIKRNIVTTNNQILGYGAGETYQQAKASALADISQQISLHVDVVTEQKITTINDKKVQKSSNQQTKIISSLILSNVAERQKTINKYGIYVLFSYKQSSLIQKINDLIVDKDCRYIEQANIKSYLKHVPALLKLSESLGCMPNIQLSFKNRQWYVSYKNKITTISLDEFKQFLIPQKSKIITLKLSEHTIEHKETYIIRTEVIQKGFLSLILISDKGKSQVLQENIKVTPHKIKHFPDPEKYLGFQGLNNENKEAIKDLVIAALCKQPADLSSIDLVNSSFEETKNEYFLPYLFEKLQSCQISSQFIIILPSPRD